MSEVQAEGAGPDADRRREAESILGEILRRMGYPARFEFKDGADGTLLVAVHLEGDVPPVMLSTKRSSPVDALQLLANKILNRPGTPRRWMQLGVNAFPEPRGPREERQKQPSPLPAPAVAAAAPAQGDAPPARGQRAPKPERPARGQQQQQKEAPPARGPRSSEPDERTLEVAEDAALIAAARAMAERSARFGRYFAVVGTSADQRAQLLKGGAGVAEVALRAEGEGFLRRVVFTPAKPVALPKRPVMPDFDDEEDE